MTAISSDEATAQLAAIIEETFEGPPGEWHHFTDASPDSGYFGTIAKLSCNEARRPIAGTSVAQQVSHAAVVMDASTALLRGDTESPALQQWEASWLAAELDNSAWQQLQQQLRQSYRRLRETIDQHTITDAAALGAVVGMIAHLAHHLGAIGQKIAMLKEVG